jgi:uncharacterized protein (TIGR02996 family)
MTDHDALLAAIIAHPDEDTPRLVFADWLQEYDDPDRGEFIRLELELARMGSASGEDEPQRQRLMNRRVELLNQHRLEWLRPFMAHTREPCFERGFVTSLCVSAQSFLHHADNWFAITPLRRVKIDYCSELENDESRYSAQMISLLDSPHLAKLEAIDLEECNLSPAHIERLSVCEAFPLLRTLKLAFNMIGNEGANSIAGMPQLSRLESLDLMGNGISDARAIAQSPYLGGLKELRMARNPIRKKSWTMLELRFGKALR